MECNTCRVVFNLDDEGGVEAWFGMIPVVFCPSCYACLVDMADQINAAREADE